MPLAAIATQPWAPREQVEAAILELCRGEFVSIREIAQRLGRTPATIRKNYIPKLVADHRLELKDPENPTRPGQAYRAVDDGS